MFSSTAAAWSQPGACHYSAGNSVLDALADNSRSHLTNRCQFSALWAYHQQLIRHGSSTIFGWPVTDLTLPLQMLLEI